MEYKEKVKQVYQRISPYIRRTPLLQSQYFSEVTGSEVYFKCENLQITNSFKVRGAFNKVLSNVDRSKILVCFSGGNHGFAVSYVAKTLGMKAIVYLPHNVAQFRVEKIKALGGKAIPFWHSWDEYLVKVEECKNNQEYLYVDPFDDDDVIAGQGTIAYEILEDLPDCDVIIASVSGGGMLSGIAQYAKSFNPNIKIYGVQTIGVEAMYQSLEQNKIITLPEVTSIATSLGAHAPSARTFEIIKNYVDKVVTVTDDEAMRELISILQNEKLLVEPASSCSLSAIISQKLPDLKGKKVCVLLCGGNFSLEQVKEYI